MKDHNVSSGAPQQDVEELKEISTSQPLPTPTSRAYTHKSISAYYKHSMAMKPGGFWMDDSDAVPKKVVRRLSRCPEAGSGVHRYIYGTACLCREYYIDSQTAFRLIVDATSKCGRSVPFSEIYAAVSNAYSQTTIEPVLTGSAVKVAKWPKRNFASIWDAALAGPTLREFIKISPEKFSQESRHSDEVIDVLFPSDELLCCGSGVKVFTTKAKSQWIGCLSDQSFIVPSPMNAVTGQTKQGTVSTRCLSNTGPRKYLVIEFDFTEKGKDGRDKEEANMMRGLAGKGLSVFDLCAALHWELASIAPLVMLVSSGGKSLHGWYYCEGRPDEMLLSFMKYAVSIGADPATWTPCQLVRMPDGTRDNGARQEIVYFNKEVLP